MPIDIIEEQRRLREIGRFRLGHKENGRPVKGDRLRFTSPSSDLAQAAADLWGGEVKPWESPSGPAFEVRLTADRVRISVPPIGEPFTQWFEEWSGGGAKHRCNGYVDQITEGRCPCAVKAKVDEGEVCPPAKRACKPITRLSLVVPELPGLGVVVLTTTGWNAAVEIPTQLEAIAGAQAQGVWLDGWLGMEKRKDKKGGETHEYVVPYIELDILIDKLLTAGDAQGLRVLEAPVAALPVIEAPPVLELEAGDKGGGEVPEPAAEATGDPSPVDSASSESGTAAPDPSPAFDSETGEVIESPPMRADQRKLLFAAGKASGIHEDDIRRLAHMILGHGLSEATADEATTMQRAIERYVEPGSDGPKVLIDWLEKHGDPLAKGEDK